MQKIFGLISSFKSKLGKWFWVFIAVLVVVVFVLISSNKKAVKVEVTNVTKGNLIETISTSGSINADQYSNLTFPSGGLVAWVGVVTGQKVVKGQSIARLDTVVLNAAYEQALNNYRNYQAIVDNVYDQLQGNATTETYSERATRTTAEVNRDNAYNAVLAAQDNLRNAVIYAPFAGIMDTVSPSSPGVNMLPGSAKYTLVNPASVYFDAEVAETDLPHVAVGQSVNISLDAYPGESFQGTVQTIGMVAFISSTGGNAYHARISLPENTNMKFRVGMGGDADIIFNKIENVTKIPVSALVTDSSDYVWAIADGKAKQVPVTVGGESNDEVEIKSGLTPGQEIIDNPVSGLKENQRVSH